MADDPKDPSATDDPKDPKRRGGPDIDGPRGSKEAALVELAEERDRRQAAEKARKAAEKAAKDFEARLKEIEDKDKSEVEKLREERDDAKKEADDARSESLRAQVAYEKGLSPAQAKRISGATKEELEADADDFLESIKPSDDKGTPPGKPRERLSGGSDPTEEPEETDPAKLAAKVHSGLVV